MKRSFLSFLLLSFLNAACGQSPRESPISYPENVGDISFDKEGFVYGDKEVTLDWTLKIVDSIEK